MKQTIAAFGVLSVVGTTAFVVMMANKTCDKMYTQQMKGMLNQIESYNSSVSQLQSNLTAILPANITFSALRNDYLAEYTPTLIKPTKQMNSFSKKCANTDKYTN